MKDYGVIERTEITMHKIETVRYPLMNPKYLNQNDLWDGEWLEKLPKKNQQTSLFDEL